MPQGSPSLGVRSTQLAGAAFAAWFRNPVDWMKALALPLAILFLVYYGIWQALVSVPWEEMSKVDDGSSLRDTATMVVQMIVLTLFAVSWHRLIILEEKPRLLPAVGGHHVRYLLWLLIFGLVFFLAATMVTALAAGSLASGSMSLQAGIMGVVGFCLLLYLLARFSPFFAALAVGERVGPASAWRMTRGQGMALFFAFLMVLLPVFFLAAFLAGVVASDIQTNQVQPGQVLTYEEFREILLGAYWITSVISAAISFAAGTLVVGVASAAYKALR